MFIHEAWVCNAHILAEGPEKTQHTDIVIAAHAKRENHYAIFVC